MVAIFVPVGQCKNRGLETEHCNKFHMKNRKNAALLRQVCKRFGSGTLLSFA